MRPNILIICCTILAVPVALAAITASNRPTHAAAAPQPGQVEAATVSPAPACHCDPRYVKDLEKEVAGLKARYLEQLDLNVKYESRITQLEFLVEHRDDIDELLKRGDNGNWFDGNHWRNGNQVYIDGRWQPFGNSEQFGACGPGGCSTGRVFGGRLFGRR